jgi:hypothetical protein
VPANPSKSLIKVAPSTPSVNLLLFVDDHMLFLKAISEGAMEVSNSLEVYCQAYDQRINRGKSPIYFSKRCSQVIRDGIKSKLEDMNETYFYYILGYAITCG